MVLVLFASGILNGEGFRNADDYALNIAITYNLYLDVMPGDCFRPAFIYVNISLRDNASVEILPLDVLVNSVSAICMTHAD